VRANLAYAPCPGFAIRKCLHCKKTWMSSAPELCAEINRYCPICIPAIGPVLRDWELNPDRAAAEIRIQEQLAKRGHKLGLSVSAQRQLIMADRKARRTA
jgi:hypothetical protein